MSLVYITFHNENVFDLENEDEFDKPPRFTYTSKFRELIKKQSFQSKVIDNTDGRKLLTSSGKHDQRTMGQTRTPLNTPSQYLRKNQGIKWLRIHDHVCPRDSRLPPLPRRPTIESKTSKSTPTDFVSMNINGIKQIPIKNVVPRYVDATNGHCQNMVQAGLIPQHVHGGNFGKVPYYLRTHKRFIEKMRNVCTMKEKTLNDDHQCMQMFGVCKMTDEERSNLLEGLKANFMEQSKHFQRLSLFTDTLAKKMRKSRIENMLRQLEQDIYLMEKNSVIYISKY